MCCDCAASAGASMRMPEQRRQPVGQLAREVRPLAREGEKRLGGDPRDGHGLGPAAADVFLGQRLVAEMFERRRFQRMPRTRGVEEIAREHRVEFEACECDAVARQEQRIELQIVTELADRRVFEQRAQPLERGGAVDLRRRGRARQQVVARIRTLVAERHVAGLSIAHGKREADNRRAHRRRPARNDAQRELAGRAQLRHQRVELAGRAHQRVILLDTLGRWRVLVDERAEGQAREQLVAALARGAVVAKRVDVDLDRHVGPDGHQLAALQRCRTMRDERVTRLRLELGGSLEERVQAAVLRQQIDGAFLADAGHAGHVVAGVADEREHVDDLRRLHAEFLDDALRVEPRAVLAGVVDADAVVHELKEILVDRHDCHLETVVGGARRQRPDHVVGFVPCRRDDRNAERFAGLVDPVDLLREIVRHRDTIRLVVVDDPVAERRPWQVE